MKQLTNIRVYSNNVSYYSLPNSLHLIPKFFAFILLILSNKILKYPMANLYE